MQYILTGFSHEMGFRVFTFEAVSGKERIPYSVRADLALSRRYGIRVQDLPQLCRDLLARSTPAGEQRAFTYTEADMSLHVEDCASRTAQSHRKTHRRPAAANVGSAWRGTRI